MLATLRSAPTCLCGAPFTALVSIPTQRTPQHALQGASNKVTLSRPALRCRLPVAVPEGRAGASCLRPAIASACSASACSAGSIIHDDAPHTSSGDAGSAKNAHSGQPATSSLFTHAPTPHPRAQAQSMPTGQGPEMPESRASQSLAITRRQPLLSNPHPCPTLAAAFAPHPKRYPLASVLSTTPCH